MLIDFFPWPTVIAPKDGANVYSKFGRNPTAHALGLDVPDAPEIGINKGPLSERRRILELEDAASLPAWAAPALRQQATTTDRRRWPLLGLPPPFAQPVRRQKAVRRCRNAWGAPSLLLTRPQRALLRADRQTVAVSDWFWEGNVQRAVIGRLVDEGFSSGIHGARVERLWSLAGATSGNP